jgi:hypothetical protein
MGRPLWREDGSAFCICYWPSPAESFLGPRPFCLVTIFYCLRFETSISVASYDLQGHDGGIRPRLHTAELQNCPFKKYLADWIENIFYLDTTAASVYIIVETLLLKFSFSWLQSIIYALLRERV